MQPISTVVRSNSDTAGIAESARGGAAVAPKAWGWPVRASGSSLLLETTSGFCGVEMRQSLGDAVLRLLCQAGTEGPVVRVMRPEPWLIFIAEADSVVTPDMLPGVAARLIERGRTIPLPPTHTGSGPCSWVVAPQPNHRWLPALSTIVWALRTARSTY
jgi:hypothetical protein